MCLQIDIFCHGLIDGKCLPLQRSYLARLGPSETPILLHRRASTVTTCAGDAMTNHAGLVRAEHIGAARTKTNWGGRHVVGNQRRADNGASGHAEGVPALHKRDWAKTGEKFVDETRLPYGTERGRRARRSWST